MAYFSDKRSVQQPIPIPRDYVPISFPSGDERYRGRSSSRPYRGESQATNANYYPSSKSHGYPSSSLDDRYYRSSSQQPRGTTTASSYIPSSNYYPSSKSHELRDRYGHSSSDQPTSASQYTPSSNKYHGYDASGSPSRLNNDRYRRSASQEPRGSTNASPYIPSSNDYNPSSGGYDNRYSPGSPSRLTDRYPSRSSSQQPRGSDQYRPTYSRRRSHSYDVSGRGGGPHHIPTATETSGMRTIRASETVPTYVRPSHKQPLIVPIGNGRNGWVVVPTNGQEVRVVV